MATRLISCDTFTVTGQDPYMGPSYLLSEMYFDKGEAIERTKELRQLGYVRIAIQQSRGHRYVADWR